MKFENFDYLFCVCCLVFNFSFKTTIANDCSSHCNSCDYVGSVNVTKGGHTCNLWSQHTKYPAEAFPDRNFDDAANFCRNPNRRTGSPAWCYVNTEQGWDYCNSCDRGFQSYHACTLPSKGQHYNGLVSITMSGHKCLPWSVAFTRFESFASENFPEKDINAAHIYCRNPDPSRKDGPWCYTTSTDESSTWEYCDVCRPFRGEFTEIPSVKSSMQKTTTTTGINNCLAYCATHVLCTGVDVQLATKDCFFMAHAMGKVTPAANFIHYEVKRSCDKRYVIRPKPDPGPNVLSFIPYVMKDTTCIGSYYEGKYITRADCENRCMLNPDCYYTFNQNNNYCYLTMHECTDWDSDPYIFTTYIRCDPEFEPLTDEPRPVLTTTATHAPLLEVAEALNPLDAILHPDEAVPLSPDHDEDHKSVAAVAVVAGDAKVTPRSSAQIILGIILLLLVAVAGTTAKVAMAAKGKGAKADTEEGE